MEKQTNNTFQELLKKLKTSSGQWITIIKELPTTPSPPKLSVLWSYPHINIKAIKQSIKTIITMDNPRYITKNIEKTFNNFLKTKKMTVEQFIKQNESSDTLFSLFHKNGSDDNWINSRRINYHGQDIVVLASEYIYTNINLLHKMIDNNVYTLQAGNVAEQQYINYILNKEGRKIYDAALVDGCTHFEAIMVAMEIDILKNKNTSIPPIGWYTCNPKYTNIFCR